MRRGLLILLLFCRVLTLSATESDWPEQWLPFFNTLTYPQSEWQPDDFGKDSSEQERQLLADFAPRIYIAPHSLIPIDFYKNYLPHTVLKDVQGHTLWQDPTRQLLKQYERHYGYYLDYHGPDYTINQKHLLASPTLYGRVFYETLTAPADQVDTPSIPVIILKYSAVFTASGMPAGLSWYQSLGTHILGDLVHWHQLDIHGAVHVMIKADDHRPLAVLLAEHNPRFARSARPHRASDGTAKVSGYFLF